MPFNVRALNLDCEWFEYEIDSLIYAIEKFKHYYYAGHEKIELLYIYK